MQSEQNGAPRPEAAAEHALAPLDLTRLLPGPGQDPRLCEAPVEVLTEVDSTNDELLRRLAAGAEHGGSPADPQHLSALLTEHQVSGRGRRDRTWATPRRSAAIVSFLLRPGLPAESLHWATLLLALSARTAIARTTGVRADLKWPNDLLVGGRKVAGILARVAPASAEGWSVVVGVGINTGLRREDLPVETATSLDLEAGAPVDRTALLAELIHVFRQSVARFEAVDGDPSRSWADEPSLLQRVRDGLDTLGREVRVQRADEEDLVGVAEDIEDDGALVVRRADGARERVGVGDVVHLRPRSGSWTEHPGGGAAGTGQEQR